MIADSNTHESRLTRQGQTTLIGVNVQNTLKCQKQLRTARISTQAFSVIPFRRIENEECSLKEITMSQKTVPL